MPTNPPDNLADRDLAPRILIKAKGGDPFDIQITDLVTGKPVPATKIVITVEVGQLTKVEITRDALFPAMEIEAHLNDKLRDVEVRQLIEHLRLWQVTSEELSVLSNEIPSKTS